MTNDLTRAHEPLAPRRLRNTAEPSRELSVGDVVSAGEDSLAVGRPVGWDPVTGPLAEDSVSGHGTHPLPGTTHEAGH